MTSSGGRAFGRSPFGYRRSQVDAYLADVESARRGLEAEIERLRPAEPLTRVGSDIAALLTSFAETVSALRDRINTDAERLRLEAEAYAETRRVEADRLYEEARRDADAAASEIVNQARAEVAALAGQQLTIAEALERAAQGITASRQALSHLSFKVQSAPVVVVPEPSTTIEEPGAHVGQPTWPTTATG
jgi:cell division septum initiation protein DivIVA